ncbi:MAG: LysM peptidoglycan-binding domain-containing protein [Myxococcales bacterium]|jgi:LysM repeat protein
MSYYAIKPGETLGEIARRFNTTVSAIARANGIQNPENVPAGMKLVIPGWDGLDSFESASVDSTYKVKSGDSLYTIARKFGTTPDALMALNGIRNPNNLQVGQILKIPGAAPSPEPAGRTYEVKRGDSLYLIARKLGTTPEALMELNGIRDPYSLQVGQVLKVPGAAPAPEPEGRTYKVQRGDSFYTIARQFNTTAEALMAYNGIRDPNSLQPGQILRLPESTTPSPTPGPSPVEPGGALPNIEDKQFTFEELWPAIQRYAAQYRADPKIVAGIIMQESTFKNWRVHHDGTGHGLIGLDDNGELPRFEKWSGLRVGRGRNAKSIPPEKQIEYLAKTIGELTAKHGSGWAAARAWHRGDYWAMNDAKGYRYESFIRQHVAALF